jgi:DNA polymerase/3'-5' exonuclease PolX
MSSVCVVPSNLPIYQALLVKADSYPPSEHHKHQAYRKAANSISESRLDIAGLYNRHNPSYRSIVVDYVGETIEEFIIELINGPDVVVSNPDGSVSTVCPANQPIYNALMAKADSFTLSKPSKAKAYSKAAKEIVSLPKDIYSLYNKQYGFIDWRTPTTISITVERFINDFIAETLKSD